MEEVDLKLNGKIYSIQSHFKSKEMPSDSECELDDDDDVVESQKNVINNSNLSESNSSNRCLLPKKLLRYILF